MRKGFLCGFIVILLCLSGLLYGLPTKKAQEPPILPDTIHYTGLEVSVGNNNAPLTVIMYYSLTCGHCSIFMKQVYPEIEKNYIDTGIVRFIFRDFPTDNLALQAAHVAWCMGQSHYLSFAKHLLENQESWVPSDENPKIASQKALSNVALKLGINRQQFNSCLNDKSLEDSILKASFHAQKEYQFRGAPGFVLNGKPVKEEFTVAYLQKTLLSMGIHPGSFGG